MFAHTGECDAAEWDAESWAKQEVEEASLLTLLKQTKQVQQEGGKKDKQDHNNAL